MESTLQCTFPSSELIFYWHFCRGGWQRCWITVSDVHLEIHPSIETISIIDIINQICSSRQDKCTGQYDFSQCGCSLHQQLLLLFTMTYSKWTGGVGVYLCVPSRCFHTFLQIVSWFIFFLSPPDLIHCTNELNVSIPHLADTLLERTTSNSWIVVFKALITTHHLMMYGNEVSQPASTYGCPGKFGGCLSPLILWQQENYLSSWQKTLVLKRS